MVKFCKQCEGLLLPTKIDNGVVFKCNICGSIESLKKESAALYKTKTEIDEIIEKLKK